MRITLNRKLYSISSSDIRRVFGYDIEVEGNFPSSVKLEDFRRLCNVDIPDLIYEKEKNYIVKDLGMSEEKFKSSLVIVEIDINEKQDQITIDVEMDSQVMKLNRWLGWWTADIDISGNGKLALFDVAYND